MPDAGADRGKDCTYVGVKVSWTATVSPEGRTVSKSMGGERDRERRTGGICSRVLVNGGWSRTRCAWRLPYWPLLDVGSGGGRCGRGCGRSGLTALEGLPAQNRRVRREGQRKEGDGQYLRGRETCSVESEDFDDGLAEAVEGKTVSEGR